MNGVRMPSDEDITMMSVFKAHFTKLHQPSATDYLPFQLAHNLPDANVNEQ